MKLGETPEPATPEFVLEMLRAAQWGYTTPSRDERAISIIRAYGDRRGEEERAKALEEMAVFLENEAHEYGLDGGREAEGALRGREGGLQTRLVYAERERDVLADALLLALPLLGDPDPPVTQSIEALRAAHAALHDAGRIP